jgi:hypothetical protein
VIELSQAEFELWLRSSYSGAFRIAGHTFEKTKTDEIRIDNGIFTRDEATQICSLLNSRNPFDHLNAVVAILERNGTLLWILLIVAVLLFVVVAIRIRR